MRRALGALVLSTLLVAACRDKQAPPPPALGVVTSTSPNARPARSGRCAMCGMELSAHPSWVGEVELPDGSSRFGCSVRCTLGMSMHAPKFLGVESSTLKRVEVPDYLKPGTMIPASEAWYVVDSDVRGPMGAELVPVASEADARVVVQRHGGRVVRRSDVTTALLQNLRDHGKSAP